MKIGILGAGLSGLEPGRRLKEQGKDFIIFEKDPQIGCLCRTNKTGDYYWDFAVHALYSQHKEAMDHFLAFALDFGHRKRNVKILHRGNNGERYIDYPFENGIIDLPIKEKLECIWGYLWARMRRKEIHNLQDWIYGRLGSGIAKYFMVPYNNKIWNCKLSEISTELVDSKIEPATVINFIKGALWKKNIGRAYQSPDLSIHKKASRR